VIVMTNFVIDDNLLKDAHKVSGELTEEETVNLALKEFIKRREMSGIFDLFGTVDYDEDYDHKKAR